MNINDFKQATKAAMPDAPDELHAFYMELIDLVAPKQESFIHNFEGRGEAHYTTVYHAPRVNLSFEDGIATISPHIEQGLLFMQGTDGSIDFAEVRNNQGLPLQKRTMVEKIKHENERRQRNQDGEVKMRFIAHGISRDQFGNVLSIQMKDGSGSHTTKAIPFPYMQNKGFAEDLSLKTERLGGINSYSNTSSPSMTSYLVKLMFDMDADTSEAARLSYLANNANICNFSDFFSLDVLSALNGNDATDTSLHQRQSQLSKDLHSLLSDACQQAAITHFAPAKELLDKAANHYPSENPINSNFGQFAMEHYPIALINFIITGQGNSPEEKEKVMAHRKLFLETAASEAGIDWFDEITEKEKSNRMIEFFSKLTDIIDEKKHGALYIERIMSHIDKGKFPRAIISQAMGVEYVNKNQFRHAFQNVAEQLDVALALAKLPNDWFTAKNHKGELIDIRDASPYDAMRVVQSEESQFGNSLSLNGLGYDKVKRYLVRTGKELGRLDGLLQAATKSGNPERIEQVKLAVNKDKKNISAQYAWLSKKTDAVEALIKLDEDYKIISSLGDYERSINIFLESLAKRAAYEVGGSDALEVNEQGEIEIRTKYLSEKLMKIREEDEENYRLTLDDDHPDNDCDEHVPFEDVEIDTFGQLFDKCWSIKSAAENNDRLHKSMSSISKKLGEYSNNNIEWTGLIDEPVEINGYRFIPITDRKRLLEEGVVQNHCVYTLLNPCLAGETSVFTVEDQEGQVVATMEVHQEDAEEGLIHECVQLYGARNSRVSNDIQNAGDSLIEMLNEGELSPVCLQDENDLAESIDIDDIEEAADLQMVPFLTDAIYDAYGVIKDHLPMGVTFSQIIDNTDGMYGLFSLSEAGQTLRAIDRLTTIYNLSTSQAVEMGKTVPVRMIMEHNHEMFRATMESVGAKEQALVAHRHSSNAQTLEAMRSYAEQYGNEYDMPLWSFIEDNVESYPDGMFEDSFRQCLRSVIDADCPEKGMQRFAEQKMAESQNKERKAKHQYEQILSLLPDHMSPEPLIKIYNAETQQQLRRLGIGEPERDITQDHTSLSL